MAKRRRVLRSILVVSTAVLLSIFLLSALSACGSDESIPGWDASATDQAVIDEATVGQMEPGEFQKTVTDASDRLIEYQGGDEGAFYATMLALDRGYDVYQLLTGSLNDRVEADGRITAGDGSVLPPAREPEKALEIPADGTDDTGAALSTDMLLLASLSDQVLMSESAYRKARRSRMQFWGGAVLMGEYFGEVRDRYVELKEQDQLYTEFNGRISFLTTALAARGYGVQQILEGILLDQVRVFMDPEVGGEFCFYIEHTSGVVLRPIHPPADPLAELTCPAADQNAPTGFDQGIVEARLGEWGLGESADADSNAPGGGDTSSGSEQTSDTGEEAEPSSPAEDGTPWVFEGTGLFQHAVSTEGAEVCKDSACPYVLTLFPDGRAELHVTRGFGWESGKCVERDGNIYVGNWEEVTFTILGQFAAEGPIVDPTFLVSGKFTADLATGRGGYDNEAGFSGVYDFDDPGLTRQVN